MRRIEVPTPMDKGLSRGARPDATKWNEEHTKYKCVDKLDVPVPKGAFRRDSENVYSKTKYANVIVYKVDESGDVSLFVSWTEFSRDASVIVDGAEDAKTVIFPKTIRGVQNDAFQRKAVRSAVLNEGLKKLGEYQDDYKEGVFLGTPLQLVILPSTLEKLGNYVFAKCGSLREVVFGENSALKYIGEAVF